MLKLRVNINETHLIALTTNCQVLHIELSRSKTPPTTPNTTPRLRRRLASASFSECVDLSPSAVDAENEDYDFVKEIKLTHSPVDCTFITDHLVIFFIEELL